MTGAGPARDHSAETRLAVYGTLGPGRSNAHQLAGLKGSWREGRVNGHLEQVGWGAHLGYPGLVPDPNGPSVDVMLFESHDLPAHWARLDAFEGEEYARTIIMVDTVDGPLEASIYTAKPSAT